MGEVSLEETKRLGKDLLASRAYVNNAPLLLSILSYNSPTPSSGNASNLSSSTTQCRVEALHSLHAFFIPMLRTGSFFSAARKKAQPNIDVVAAAVKNDRSGDLNDGSQSAAKAETVYRLWVWSKYREFKKLLFQIVSLSANSQILQIAAINTLMDLVREERVGEFDNSLYLKICSRMMGSKGERNEFLQVLRTKYFKYNDVRYYTYSNIDKLVTKRLRTKRKGKDIVSGDDDNSQGPVGASLHAFARNVYDVLSHLPLPSKDEQKDGNDAEELWSNSLDGEDSGKGVAGSGQEEKNPKRKGTRKQRHVLSRAWLSLLQLPLPLDVYKKVVARLHRNVVPYMTNPVLLSDFLTQSYNTGGLISVMALGSLYILITKYGLEYPDFYNKLYALLEPSIFVARYRSRFFELLDTCLKSSHLPGYLGAAFAKRLGRLVLSAPPSGAIVVIALIHNLLRRHPSINVLVHRIDSKPGLAISSGDSVNGKEGEAVSSLEVEQQTQDKTLEGRLGADPFIATEADVAKCNALKSSLWEMESLRSHYSPVVSRFVESLENDLTVRAKTTAVAIQDFSAASYATIFEEEVGRRMKSVPMAFYSTVASSLFPQSNSDDSFNGWRFDKSAGLNSETVRHEKVHEVDDTGKGLEDASNKMEDYVESEDSMEDYHQSEELSSDGSGGSRSRSEQSDGDDWSQPLLKRLRGPESLETE